VFFEYSSVAKSVVGVSLLHSNFESNMAFGELCTVPNQAGQGGALAVVGASVPAVYLSHVNFTHNIALTATKKSSSYRKAEGVSLGGALSIALSSNITLFKSVFSENVAYNGAGNDVSSISGQSNQENFVHATDSTFVAGTRATESQLTQQAAVASLHICLTLNGFLAQAKTISVDASSQAIHRSLLAGATADRSASSVFLGEVPAQWHAHLLPPSKRAERGRAGDDGFQQLAAIVKRARWMYLRHRDQALLHLPDAREMVNAVVQQILVLDLWRAAQRQSNYDATEIVADESYASRPAAQHPSTQFTTYGRRAQSNNEANNAQHPASMVELEKVYRANLYAQLDAEFDRLERKQRRLRGGKSRGGVAAQLVEFGEEDALHEDYSTTATPNPNNPNNPADALLNFHPFVVITSGKAYFENPTFRGVYHMFFGDFPQIAEYAYDDSHLFSTIVAVPSYSAIFGHITQDDLTITAITASIEIFDSNDSQNYTVHQVNLFNATMQLNRNVTVTGGSFVTGSLITGVSQETSSLIPYVAGGDTHPFVTFADSLYTGVSLQAILQAVGSALDRSDSGGSNSSQTLVTLNSVSWLYAVVLPLSLFLTMF
jgi:hypothetical protein